MIKRIARFTNFEQLLANEDPTAFAPDVPVGRLLALLREIYPADKEALGILALEIAREEQT